MNTHELGVYLNDHLAGSVAAVELLDDVAETYDGQPLAAFFRELRTDIQADQDVLREMVDALGAGESGVRKAGAWLMEKVGTVKLQLAEDRGGEFGLYQALEGLALGITGKQLLWRALALLTRNVPEISGHDFAKLEQRAVDQRDRVDAKRIEIARKGIEPDSRS
jgi:hypothetical protein